MGDHGWSIRVILTGLLAASLLVGCRAAREVRDPEYYQLEADIAQAWMDPAPVEAAIDPVAPELAGPHPVEDYIWHGLAQNPRIHAARLRVESLAQRVPQAASLQDPTLGVTVQPEPVQTAAGEQDVILAVGQKVPWFGKLATQADVAEQAVEVARAELAAAELEVIEQIKRAYYQLYFVQQAIRITEQDKQQLQLIETIVDRMYSVERKVTQQDVLRIQLELSRLETELVELRQQLDSAQASLAGLLHISPETPLRAVDNLPAESIPQDLARLYRQAISDRPELQAALAAIQRDRRAADLARLNYFPDVTLGVTWIETSSTGLSPVANGRDAVLLAASINLPIYRRRLEAGVREAETRAVATARQYDATKDQTMADVKDLFAQATSQQQLLQLFRRDLIPTARQTLEQSIASYEVGQVDFLQMIDNWRVLLRLEIGAERLEAQLRQSLASLDRIIGSYELRPAGSQPAPPSEPVPPVVVPQ